jgi:hypothetical protein
MNRHVLHRFSSEASAFVRKAEPGQYRLVAELIEVPPQLASRTPSRQDGWLICRVADGPGALSAIVP